MALSHKGWHRLPPEIVDILLNGGGADGRRYLASRWRFAAALVCTQWRLCVAAPSSSDAAAILAEATAAVRHHQRGNDWVAGRLTCTSTLSQGLALGELSLEEALTWLRRARASDAVCHAVLVASRQASAIEHARLRFPLDGVAQGQEWVWLAHDVPITGDDDPRLDCDDYYPCQSYMRNLLSRPSLGRFDILRVACRSGAADVVGAMLCDPHLSLDDEQFALCARDASVGDHHEVVFALYHHARAGNVYHSHVLSLCETAATHSAMRSLKTLDALGVSFMRPQSCWHWLDAAAAADAVDVLDWFWRRNDGHVPTRQTLLSLMAAAVTAGALCALEWLTARLGAIAATILIGSFGLFVHRKATPRQHVVGIEWLVNNNNNSWSADRVVSAVYAALRKRQKRRIMAPLLDRWPLAVPRLLWREIPEAMSAALRDGRWRFVDRIVTAAERALAKGAHGNACDLWNIATCDLLGVLKRGITPDNLDDVCSALTVLCALLHRTCLPPVDWPAQTTMCAPPPLGDVDRTTWIQWCRIRPLDKIPAHTRAYLSCIESNGCAKAASALALLTHIDNHAHTPDVQ